MEQISTIVELKECLKRLRSDRSLGTVGFVPTMGALHEGHLSLVERAKSENDIVVVSIFVNPTQFAPHEDLDRYPQTLQADLAELRSRGVDCVFVPSVGEMYPDLATTGSFTETRVVPGKLATHLEGELRPGHFDGVALVVSKLFNIVSPTRAYFGEKDYQQLLVIKQMVRDLSLGIEIVACPTVREQSGLACSSRNAYLSKEGRLSAGVLYSSMRSAQAAYAKGVRDALTLRGIILDTVNLLEANDEKFRIVYAVIVDAQTLEPCEVLSDNPEDSRIILSVNFEGTHLIDNDNFVE